MDIRRPRSHELENLTKQRLRNLLPVGWIVRGQDPDYGVDEQVQIVQEGAVTPLLFGVQLKGTDVADRSADGVKYAFETKHLQHYLQLPFPMLLAVLDAETDVMFIDWVHRIYSKLDIESRRRWQTQQTVTLELTRSLTQTEHAEIVREVAAFNGRPRPEADRDVAIEIFWKDVPLEVQANVRERLIGWMTVRHQASRLRMLAPTYDARIVVSRTELTLDHDGWTATIHLPVSSTDAEWEKQAIPAIQVASSYLLFQAGRPQAGADLLIDLLADLNPLPESVQFALCTPFVALMFGSTRRTSDALVLAERLLSQGDLNCAAILGAAIVVDREATSLDRVRQDRLLSGIVAAAAPSPGRAAVHYSLANALRNVGSRRRALRHYRRAAMDDPSYRTRAYWWAEVGGCLFGARRFCYSERFYRKAVALSDAGDNHTLPLLADALFRQGRLGEAKTELDKYLSSDPGLLSPDAVLHHWAVHLLADSFGDDICQDEIGMAMLMDKALAEPDLERGHNLLRLAVTADPMCPLAWFNLAASENRGGPARSWKEFLLAAILIELDVEAWANAILIQVSLGTGDPMIVAATLATAYRIHGAMLDEEMMRLMKGSGAAEEARLKILARIRSYLEDLSPQIFVSNNRRTLRWIHNPLLRANNIDSAGPPSDKPIKA